MRQDVAGLGIVTDGDLRFTADIGGQSSTSYPTFRMSGRDGKAQLLPLGVRGA